MPWIFTLTKNGHKAGVKPCQHAAEAGRCYLLGGALTLHFHPPFSSINSDRTRVGGSARSGWLADERCWLSSHYFIAEILFVLKNLRIEKKESADACLEHEQQWDHEAHSRCTLKDALTKAARTFHSCNLESWKWVELRGQNSRFDGKHRESQVWRFWP